MKMKKKDKYIEKIKQKKEEQESSNRNLFVVTVIIIIIVTFIFTSGSLRGMSDSLADIGKEKIKNEDGSISIPADAQILGVKEESRETQQKYLGKVYGEKIQLFRDDRFNENIQKILSYNEIDDSQKIMWIRAIFDQEINMIIGMNNAKKMGIEISKDYLVKEVGVRYYTDRDGDIDNYKMKKDQTEVNRKAELLKDQLLYENFRMDYFEGLPVSYEEILDSYKLDNIKVKLEYIDISNIEISNELLKKYYNTNKEKYKQYKLIRLFFKSKEFALENLNKIKQEPLKFIEIGEKLKAEDKITSIKFDSEYLFLDDFVEPQLIEAIKKTQINQVGDQIIESDLGNFIFLVENIIYGNFGESKTYEKVKKDYLLENYETVDKNNKEKAEKIYDYSLKNNLTVASKTFNYELKTSSPCLFMGYNIPNINPDQTDDLNYMVEIFKSSKGEILKPYKYENGYMIASLIEKEEIAKDKIESLYNDLTSRYSNRKSQGLEGDYYSYERKKAKIVDNFRYLNFQLLMPKKEENQ